MNQSGLFDFIMRDREENKKNLLFFHKLWLQKCKALYMGFTISLDDFKNLWQIFEKLLFSVNDYDFVLGLLDDINAFDGWEIHILKINYH